MAKKYFCWNIDDGLEQDKKITKYFRRCGIGATFNLNSGLMGEKQLIGRIGNLGMKTVPTDSFKSGIHFMKYSDSNRIPADEVKQVYEGFEVASHGLMHDNFLKITDVDAKYSIGQDVVNLNKIFGTTIQGFAYPFGQYNETTIKLLQDAGIKYARTVQKAADFDMPKDYLRLPMTAWHINKDVFEKLDAFLRAESEKDQFFLMFGHGYEFDFNTRESNWEKFFKICDLVANRTDVICCSTSDALLAQNIPD